MNISKPLAQAANKFKRVLPWLSLAFGVASAFFMDRSGKRAWVMIALSLLGFVVLVAFSFVQRLVERAALAAEENEEDAGKSSHRWIQIGVTFATQSIVQNCLLFSLPYYVLAAQLDVGHVIFLLLMAALTALSLWDPLYNKIVHQFPLAIFFIQSFAAFVTLNAVLPPAGLSNRMSFVVAAALGGLGVPLFALLNHEGQKRVAKAALASLVAVTFIALALFLGGARLVPAAPYRVLYGALGTTLGDRVVADAGVEPLVAPNQLVCATIVSAPNGIKDKLFHVWHKSNKQSDRIPLEIKGRERGGYFTYSRKKNLGKTPKGDVSCSVMTETGQLLHRSRRTLLLKSDAP